MVLKKCRALERLKNVFRNDQDGTGSKYDDCCGTFKKPVRNPEYSKVDHSKKLSILAAITRFYAKSTCTDSYDRYMMQPYVNKTMLQVTRMECGKNENQMSA